MKNTVTRLIAAVIISTFAMAPALASAQTASSTAEDQIKALMEQIHTLQQQVMTLMKARHGDMASSTPQNMDGDSDGTKRPCPAFTRDLRRGAQGDDVRELQQHLMKALPDAFSEDKVTGFFGPATEKALKHFQEMSDMGTSTGFFGPRTRMEMGKRCGQMMGNGMPGMMGSSTMPKPWEMHDRMMGSSTMPKPPGMWNWGGGEGDDNHGPRPPMHPMSQPGSDAGQH